MFARTDLMRAFPKLVLRRFTASAHKPLRAPAPTISEALPSLGQEDMKAIVNGTPTLVKMVCSIGPVSEDAPTLHKIAAAGMQVMRINFSHATYEEANMRVTNLRSAPGMHRNFGMDFNLRSVMLDTKGPEIRLGNLAVGGENKITLEEGSTFELSTDEQYKESGTPERLFISYANLCEVVKVGTRILFDDGAIEVIVESIGTNSVQCRVLNTGKMKSRRGVNLPGVLLPGLPTLTDKDKRDLKWGIENDVDFVAASFVRKAADVRQIRAFMERTYEDLGNPFGAGHPLPMIISKIENLESLDNFEEILKESDGIMVARGDLGVEMPFSRVTAAQKHMILACNSAGKPVIVATQMLETMQVNPRPTRAEVSDVTNAVFDGADAVMLSGESANGDYPVESVSTMRRIVAAADSSITSFGVRHPGGRRSQLESGIIPNLHYKEAVARAACRAALQMNARAIITVTESGRLAQFCSKYAFYDIPIIACVGPSPAEHKIARQLGICRSIIPVAASHKSDCSRPQEAIRLAKEMGLIDAGDLVVLLFKSESATLANGLEMVTAQVK